MKTLPKIRTGFEIPKKIFKDTDNDGAWDELDCEPRNPNKQGPLGYAVGKYLRKRKGIVGRAAKGYEEYKEGAPQREQARIESLKRRAQIEEQKARISKARRTRTMARPTAAMDYGRFFGLGAGVTPRAKPKPTVKRKRRKRKKKR